jgi:hypothetical protein
MTDSPTVSFFDTYQIRRNCPQDAHKNRYHSPVKSLLPNHHSQSQNSGLLLFPYNNIWQTKVDPNMRIQLKLFGAE